MTHAAHIIHLEQLEPEQQRRDGGRQNREDHHRDRRRTSSPMKERKVELVYICTLQVCRLQCVRMENLSIGQGSLRWHGIYYGDFLCEERRLVAYALFTRKRRARRFFSRLNVVKSGAFIKRERLQYFNTNMLVLRKKG